MASSAKKPISPFRRALYGKIEIAKKQIGLDEETYRDLLESRYGKRSRKSLGNAQLVDLVEHFKSLGFRPRPPYSGAKRRGGRDGRQGDHESSAGRRLADTREARKIRALWLSLWNLGVVRDPSESALNAFAKRLTGVDDMRWMDEDGAYKVIEALKAMATREGHVEWDSYPKSTGVEIVRIERPRARVLEAQWRRLYKLGLVRLSDTSALSGWLERFIGAPGRINYLELDGAQADRAIAALGERIRKAMGQREPAS